MGFSYVLVTHFTDGKTEAKKGKVICPTFQRGQGYKIYSMMIPLIFKTAQMPSFLCNIII